MNWSDFFELVGDKLYWKARPRSDFASELSFIAFNQRFSGKEAGTLVSPKKRKTKYYGVRVNNKSYRVHNIIYEMRNGVIPDGLYVDHIDGDGLNNSVDNLRLVSHIENCRNRSIQQNNTSGCQGVTWRSDIQKWRVRINYDGARRTIGNFEDFATAVAARKLAETKHGYHKNHGRVA